jgi:hypothetical protein
VTTVGGGVLVTTTVVGVKDETDDCWEGLCDEDLEDVVVPRTGGLEVVVPRTGGDDEAEQLAKTVEIGLTSVIMLVITSGTDIVETPPKQPSI